ncbi:MAG: universal stress protein [Desulforhabdus sp.]|jgi:nucleotide-binding universal stress UspA family protein|nr:universal stress protein [Desulforhabdus sp.]
MESEKKRILIAVDGSKQSFEAVRYAGLVLPAGRAKITLFHILNLIPEDFSDLRNSFEFLHRTVDFHTWELQQRRSIEDFMEQSVRLLLSQGYSKDAVSIIIKDRKVGIARDIMSEASKGYEALVLGRRGLSDLKGLLFGSIANKLVSHLQQVPVWTVGGHPDPRKILVAMDQSQGALRALEYVGEMLLGSRAELLLFHVSRAMVVPRSGYDGPVLPQQEEYWFEKAQEHFKRAEQEMEAIFNQCIRSMKKKGIDVSRIHTKIVPGVFSRAGAIFGEAQEGGYGTIVVGRRGLSRVEEFVMGRVSSKVLQLAEDMAVWVIQ